MADMKENISVSLEKDIISWADNQVTSGRYRNRSHVIEYALNELKKKEAYPKNLDESVQSNQEDKK